MTLEELFSKLSTASDTLDLDNEILDDAALDKIFILLKDNPHIKKLELHDAKINLFGLQTLLGYLPLLDSLNLSGIMLGSEGAAIVARYLENCKYLKILDLSNTGIGSSGVKVLCKGLAKNHTLTSLLLINSRITDEVAPDLVDALKSNGTVVSLYIGSNFISGTSSKALFEQVKNNKLNNELHKATFDSKERKPEVQDIFIQNIPSDSCLNDIKRLGT